jgi:hypothetical protein
MTENAKIAKLWFRFHRLPDKHKNLVLKIVEVTAYPEKCAAGPAKKMVKGKRK